MTDSKQSTDSSGTGLGVLITMFFNEFMEMYGDEELASVATAAVINDLLVDAREEEEQHAKNTHGKDVKGTKQN